MRKDVSVHIIIAPLENQNSRATCWRYTNRRYYRMNTSSTATAEPGDLGHDYGHRRHGCGHKGKRKWSGVELAVIIGGFVAFWPVGLVALGIKLVKGELWAGSAHSVSPWTAYKNWQEARGDKPFTFSGAHWGSHWGHGPQASTGNAAFDAYKREQLDRLEAERRKLDDEQKAFAEHLAKLRRAKDQDEFDRFMAERNTTKPAEG
jgi:Protein of unknown function (DUF2852)